MYGETIKVMKSNILISHIGPPDSLHYLQRFIYVLHDDGVSMPDRAARNCRFTGKKWT